MCCVHGWCVAVGGNSIGEGEYGAALMQYGKGVGSRAGIFLRARFDSFDAARRALKGGCDPEGLFLCWGEVGQLGHGWQAEAGGQGWRLFALAAVPQCKEQEGAFRVGAEMVAGAVGCVGAGGDVVG